MNFALLRFFSLSVFSVALPVAGVAQDIIIEACQGGLNSSNYAEISGQWVNGADPRLERSSAANLTPGEKCLPRKLNTGQAGEARFYPRFTSPGHYCVYVTWPSSANAKQVLYVTRCSGNQSARTCIQNGVGYHNPANGNRWVYLGEWDFKDGGDDYISVISDAKSTTPNDPNRAGVLFADAVRFTMKPLTPADGAELFPRDRVEMRGMGSSVPAGAAPLLSATPAGKAGPGPAPAAAVSSRSTPAPSAGTMSSPPGSDSASGITWISSIQDAQKAIAGDKSKRILIYFHSKESQLCMKYDRDVFTNPEVVNLLREKYFPVKLEIEQSSDIATALGVFRGGTLLVYDSAGQGLKKLINSLETADVLRELQF